MVPMGHGLCVKSHLLKPLLRHDNQPLQILNSLSKIPTLDPHRHVYRIKIFLATKTSGQIGFGVDRGDEFRTHGAQEPEIPFRRLAGQLEKISDENVDRDFVSQLPQCLSAVARIAGLVFHCRLLFRSEIRT